jgi:hypothetical protein
VSETRARKFGRPMIGEKVEAGHGILKVAMIVGYDSGTVQRAKRAIAAMTSEDDDDRSKSDAIEISGHSRNVA